MLRRRPTVDGTFERRRRIEQEFNSDRRAEKLAHIYEGLLAERSGATHGDRIEEIVTVGQEQ